LNIYQNCLLLFLFIPFSKRNFCSKNYPIFPVFSEYYFEILHFISKQFRFKFLYLSNSSKKNYDYFHFLLHFAQHDGKMIAKKALLRK